MQKIKVVILLAVCSAVSAIFFVGQERVSALSSGPPARFSGAPGENSCVACHSQFPVNSGTGNVQILGVPANYTPGQQYPISVRVSDKEATIYGFQLTAIISSGAAAGTFQLPMEMPATTQTSQGTVGGNQRDYVLQTIDGLFTNGVFGSNTWNFFWTAPPKPVGTISFYAAGNGSNSDGMTWGDYIYTTSVSSSFASTVSVGGRVFTSTGSPLRNARVTINGPNNFSQSVITSTFGFYSFNDIPIGETYTVSVFSRSFRFNAQQVSVSQQISNLDFTGQE
ncbi:MAG: carboxypeptidase regulatory-like domain-containing protein [Acidobacteriota bacterium]|nr:MAG: carboxypeptidase regulatory-like domain-containing protein [Acidobacteriota bacterium]